MNVEDASKSPELVVIAHDPNYRWRVAAGLSTILLSLIAAILVITVSKAQSAESNIFIFGMAMTIVIIVIMPYSVIHQTPNRQITQTIPRLSSVLP